MVGSVLIIFVIFCDLFFVLFVFIMCLVYLILPISLDCPFLIAPSVFSNVYLLKFKSAVVGHVYDENKATRFRTVPKSNRKIVVTQAKSIPLLHIYMTAQYPAFGRALLSKVAG